MAHFFGLTALGDSKCFETSLDSQTERLGQISFDKFMDAFDANCIGECKLASDLQVDGTQVMLRSKLFELAEEVVGKPLDRHDHDLFRMCFDTVSSGRITRSEFEASVNRLQERIAHPGNAVQYSSGITMREDMHKHRLNHQSPQHTSQSQ